MKAFLRRLTSKNEATALNTPKPVVVTITGGMGSQILSISTYYYLCQFRKDVFVDCSYFEKPAMKAGLGEGCSQWEWELDQYGISNDALPKSNIIKNANVYRLDDGAEKMKLGLLGLKNQEIRLHFSNSKIKSDKFRSDLLQQTPYACVHIRQGDYLNVASHLIKETAYLPTLKKIARLVPHLVVSSDSELSPDFKNQCVSIFKSTNFLINHSHHDTHVIMRSATFLMTSNSTFSLSAACLNEEGFILIPEKWFDEKNRLIEVEVFKHANFRTFSIV